MKWKVQLRILQRVVELLRNRMMEDHLYLMASRLVVGLSSSMLYSEWSTSEDTLTRMKLCRSLGIELSAGSRGFGWC